MNVQTTRCRRGDNTNAAGIPVICNLVPGHEGECQVIEKPAKVESISLEWRRQMAKLKKDDKIFRFSVLRRIATRLGYTFNDVIGHESRWPQSEPAGHAFPNMLYNYVQDFDEGVYETCGDFFNSHGIEHDIKWAVENGFMDPVVYIQILRSLIAEEYRGEDPNLRVPWNEFQWMYQISTAHPFLKAKALYKALFGREEWLEDWKILDPRRTLDSWITVPKEDPADV